MKWESDFEKKIESLTPEQVKAAFNKYIDYAKITIVKAGDFVKAQSAKEKIPTSVGGASEK